MYFLSFSIHHLKISNLHDRHENFAANIKKTNFDVSKMENFRDLYDLVYGKIFDFPNSVQFGIRKFDFFCVKIC